MKWIWTCLLLVACNSGENKMAKRPAPSVPSNKVEILRDDERAIHVRLNATEQAMIEGTLVDSTDLKRQLRAAKKQQGDTATIVLHLNPDTEFGMFTSVHRSLEELLQEERDSVALARFNMHYGNLSETQQAVIKRKHHLRIIEKMNR